MSNRVERVDTQATMSYPKHLAVKNFVNESVTLRVEHEYKEPVSRRQDLMTEWVKVANFTVHPEPMIKNK